MSTLNACCVWDFTVSADKITFDQLLKCIEDISKKYCFQKEMGESGYIHYQGRVSLKIKTRRPKVSEHDSIHWSVTSVENSKNDFYCCKEDTRIDGPWKDTDTKVYIPRQIREMEDLWPWQQYLVDHHADWDTRHINVIIDSEGNSGKSSIKGYMRAYGFARPIPFCNDYKDIMRMVMDIPTSTCYLVDMPRSINKERLYQFFAGVESIKDGYAYDDRYKFQEKFFDCPNIWIFTNTAPEIDHLSKDRWVLWEIRNKELCPYFPAGGDF